MPKKIDDLPEITELEQTQVDAIIHALEHGHLEPWMKNIVIKCVELALWLPGLLQRKNISLHRLKCLLFGKGYKAKNKKPHDKDNNSAGNGSNAGGAGNSDTSAKDDEVNQATLAANQDLPSEAPGERDNTDQQPLIISEDKTKKKKPGHGRMGSDVYKDVEELIAVPLEGFQAGDLCPMKCGGRLRPYRSGTVIRIKGQNFARVLHYVVEKLRCALCDYLIVAKLPEDAGNEKYDSSFKAMIVLQKYYVAVPFYRQECFQTLLRFPLPDSTQWELVEKVAQYGYIIFNVFKELVANGKLIHNDDTMLRILDHIRYIKSAAPERVGMFTTCILGEHEGHQICLFLNGVQHGGENVDELLELRSPKKPLILQMCDGLTQQTEPKKAETVVCNCLSHGFRKFEELIDYYPEECGTIMGYIGEFYRVDKKTVDMSAEERLLHHQKHSQPVADELLSYMTSLFDNRIVEPNSELGGAIKYMIKRWDKITRFLTVAGAPLDNNISERALKIPIRNRKSAMFCRSKYSAYIAGMLTSIIYTCFLAKKNAHHYLTVLQDYYQHVRASPRTWLPWNYEASLAALEVT